MRSGESLAQVTIAGWGPRDFQSHLLRALRSAIAKSNHHIDEK